MSLKLTLLGSNSAIPSVNRWTTSQFLSINGCGVLIDCGEGCQIRLKNFGVRFNSINQIYISHLHGDHFFGLVGLISSFHLLGRKIPLTVFCPNGLKQIIDLQLELSLTKLNYELIFIETNQLEVNVVYDCDKYSVTSFPLLHSLPTTGFFFKEKYKQPNIKKNFIIEHNLSIEEIQKLKAGKDYVDENGEIFKNEDVTYNKSIAKSYAYCSDTRFCPEIVPVFQNTDLIYHEATYTSAFQHLAEERLHSTAKEAAIIAKMANAKQLIIGHFSKRYSNSADLLIEAQEVFPNTIVAEDGLVIDC